MSTQVTDIPPFATESVPVGRIPAPRTMATEQGAAIMALPLLLAEYAELPPPYITIRSSAMAGIGLQLPDVTAFEQWRDALGIDPDGVVLHTGGGEGWLAADTRYRGVPVRLTGFGVLLATVEEVAA